MLLQVLLLMVRSPGFMLRELFELTMLGKASTDGDELSVPLRLLFHDRQSHSLSRERHWAILPRPRSGADTRFVNLASTTAMSW